MLLLCIFTPINNVFNTF